MFTDAFDISSDRLAIHFEEEVAFPYIFHNTHPDPPTSQYGFLPHKTIAARPSLLDSCSWNKKRVQKDQQKSPDNSLS
jgi:hypothetical protein